MQFLLIKYNISAYGASGKGQALLQICNIGSNFLDNIYDKSKIKQGKYTPGTHIKIIDPKYVFCPFFDFLSLLINISITVSLAFLKRL